MTPWEDHRSAEEVVHEALQMLDSYQQILGVLSLEDIETYNYLRGALSMKDCSDWKVQTIARVVLLRS